MKGPILPSTLCLNFSMHDQSSARYPFLISYVWVGKGWKFIHLKKWPEILKPLHVNNGQESVLSLAGVIMESTSLLWFAYQFFLHFNVFSALKEGLQCVERVDCQAIFVCTIIYYIEYRASVLLENVSKPDTHIILYNFEPRTSAIIFLDFLINFDSRAQNYFPWNPSLPTDSTGFFLKYTSVCEKNCQTDSRFFHKH